MYYDDDFIDEVRQRNDIVDVISSYVNLKKSGSTYKGLCPFHNEKTPSFLVNPGKQIYKCFGCGMGGNVYTFLMNYNNMSFPEAVEYLAQNAGMDLPKKAYNPEQKKKADLRNQLYEINKYAGKYFYKSLMSNDGKIGLEYLKKRELKGETINHFGLGYSKKNSSLYRELKDLGYNDETLKQSGLFVYDEKNKPRDKFFNRVMYPIFDRAGKVIAFGGRVMGDGMPKYLNSPETIIFNKRNNLYGLSFLHGQSDGIIVCEGYMDVIALHQAGFTSAVATLGTSLTEEHCTLLKRYTDKIYLCYDSDGAGVKASVRAIPMLMKVGLTVKVINMQPHKDPDEFMKALSREAFVERINNAENGFLYQTMVLESKYNLSDPSDVTKFYLECADLFTVFDTAIERNAYTEAFCKHYKIKVSDFMSIINKKSGQKAREVIRKEQQQENKKNKEVFKENGIGAIQSYFLSWLINDYSLFEKTKEIITVDDFLEEPYKAVAKMVYEEYEKKGKVVLAGFVSRFETSEEQSLVTNIFSREVEALETDSEREKAFNDLVKKIKENSVDYRLKYLSDPTKFQEILKEKNEIKNIHIKLIWVFLDGGNDGKR